VTSEEQLNAEFRNRLARGMSEATAVDVTLRESKADAQAERERRNDPEVVAREQRVEAEYAAAQRVFRNGGGSTLAERLTYFAQLAEAEDKLAQQQRQGFQADKPVPAPPAAAPKTPSWKVIDKAREAKAERDSKPVTVAEMAAIEQRLDGRLARFRRRRG
jgi:hypothetical protein